MDKESGFLEIPRRDEGLERPEKRLRHFREYLKPLDEEELRAQSNRCMNCGTPFCHGVGCPLGNLIPEFNELVYLGRWREAAERLHLTNNFPEITGRLCPALCESACVNELGGSAVTVRQIELAVVEKAWVEGWIEPRPPEVETGKRVAVVGSGPAGLAAAQQLRRAGHAVTVFEKHGKPGGLPRYGIPDFKLEKRILDRRLRQLEEEGVCFELNVEVGVDLTAGYFMKKFDALGLCGGAGMPRDLNLPGREAAGIHFALEYLVQNNRRVAGRKIPPTEEIIAAGKKVAILGGGDTGADCLGVALRQGAADVKQFEIMPRPPEGENPATPWPLRPNVLRSSGAHEEGGERWWAIETVAFLTRDGQVSGLRCRRVKWEKDPQTGRFSPKPTNGEEFEVDADLVLLALGFLHPVHDGLLDGLGVEYDARGNVKTDENMATSVEGVFAAGDMQSGASLVVGALAGGRRLARGVDLYLMGESSLPAMPPLPRL